MKRTISRVIIATVIIVAINWFLLMLGASPLSFSFVYVIPIAGIIYGLIVGGFAKKGIIKDRIPYSKKGIIFVALYSSFLIFLLTALEYRTCYVTEDHSVNYFMEGDHISEYSVDDMEMTFFNYLKFSYLDSKQSESLTDDEESIIPTSIVYVLNYFAAFFFCYITLTDIEKIPMCKNCRRYYETKEIDRFAYGVLEQQVLDMILSQLETGAAYVPQNQKLSTYSYKADVSYCPECKRGKLTIYKHTVNGKHSEDVVATERELLPQYVQKFLGND